MSKLHIQFLIAVVLICVMSVSTLGGVLTVRASSSRPESKIKEKEQAKITLKSQIYNDVDPAWTYNGNWSKSKVRKAYGGQIHITNCTGDQAVISITGSRFALVYSMDSSYGKLDVFVDEVKIHTIDQRRSRTVHQKEWISPELGPGLHIVKFVHVSGKLASIDALKILGSSQISNPTPADNPTITESPTTIPPESTNSTATHPPTETLAPTLTPSPTSTILVEDPTLTLPAEITSSPTPSIVASDTPTQIPSLDPGPTPTITSTPILEPTATNTPLPTFTATIIPTSTNTPLPTFTATLVPTATNTPTPTFNPTATASPTPTTPVTGSRVFYIAVNGSDSNPGTEGQPWRSIQKAARTLIAGDTVYIRGGVYKESVLISNSGTSSQPIRFLAYPGEVPVIDGNNYQLPTSYWGVLLEISGNYVQVSGIEISYSNWMGLVLSGDHDLASNMNVHHSRETGVLVSGDYGIVQNSRIWQNANRNEVNSPYGGGGWATGLSAARHPNNAILRGNTIYNNWGEGLSTFEANGTIMEDNVVYDNWSANVYISDATNVRLQRNLIYISDNSLITSGSRIGIAMGDELYNPASRDITIINNLVYGAYRNFYWWQGNKGGGMVNVLVANNTFVNSRKTAGIQVDYGPHQNVRFFNNIIQQDGTLPATVMDSVSGITFSHNLWSKKPSSSAAGSGDIVADPNLAKSGNYTSPEWYQLGASSPGRDSGMQIGGLTEDFFKTPRGEFPDIGAFEN